MKINKISSVKGIISIIAFFILILFLLIYFLISQNFKYIAINIILFCGALIGMLIMFHSADMEIENEEIIIKYFF